MKKLLILLLFTPSFFSCDPDIPDRYVVEGKTVLIVYPDKIEALIFTDFSQILKNRKSYYSESLQNQLNETEKELAEMRGEIYEPVNIEKQEISIYELNEMDNKNVFINYKSPSNNIKELNLSALLSSAEYGIPQSRGTDIKTFETLEANYSRSKLYVTHNVKENFIYRVKKNSDTINNGSTFSSIEYNNEKFDLYSVWDFDKVNQNFIYNNTGKDLFLETVVYDADKFINNNGRAVPKTNTDGPKIRIEPNKVVESNLPDYLFGNHPPYSIEFGIYNSIDISIVVPPFFTDRKPRFWLHY